MVRSDRELPYECPAVSDLGSKGIPRLKLALRLPFERIALPRTDHVLEIAIGPARTEFALEELGQELGHAKSLLPSESVRLLGEVVWKGQMESRHKAISSR